jgi:hypothetical protein
MAGEFLESKPRRSHRGAKILLSIPEISIPAPVLSARIDMILDGELSPLGFERIRPRLWVESNHPPIRRLFEFQPVGGDIYSARWGFSLDFVPTKRAEKLAWKRTPKTARFDLSIDPIDNEGRPREWFSVSRFIYPVKEYDWGKLARTVKDTAKGARPDFNHINSIEDIVAIFSERSTMKLKRFSLENYVQTHIAWGLSLIAIGEPDEGEKHLQTYCATFSIDRNDRILRQAEQTAIALADER